ncbi:MAG: hypothetical protein D6761_09850 [Candidatus Dadabacteria bacterium]|nr:MAG: hypothetical protein D6761_09850 [Candidatus Dadabacteria bacterium]
MELLADMQHIIFLILLALLWWLWLEVKRYRLEKTRQAIFAIRDDLFLRAREGAIDFDSDAYRLTRALLNGAIQYAERISLIRIMGVRRIMRKHGLEGLFASRMRAALDGLTKEQKRLILDCIEELDGVLISHMVRSSLPLMIIVEVARVFHIIGRLRAAARLGKTINNDLMMDGAFA